MDIDAVWAEYRQRIRAFLHSRVSNPADVDDLLQDISLKVFSGLPSLNNQAKLKSWLFQTAQNAIVDFYRKSGRGKDLHPSDLWYEANDARALDELERCVEPFIDGLPEDLSALLRAVDIEGVFQKDYAQAHGISYSTLKSRVQKGRAELRTAFEDCCHMSLDARGNIADISRKSSSCKKC